MPNVCYELLWSWKKGELVGRRSGPDASGWVSESSLMGTFEVFWGHLQGNDSLQPSKEIHLLSGGRWVLYLRT